MPNLPVIGLNNEYKKLLSVHFMIFNSKHSTDLYSHMFAKCHLCHVNEVYSIFLINISVFHNISIISPIFLALDVKHLRYSIEYYPLTENK